MAWRSFEKELPRDGQHILILTRGCSSSAAEAFYIKASSVDKYHKTDLVSEEQFKEINKIIDGLKMTEGYGHTVSYPSYYVIAPIFSKYEEQIFTNCLNFKWIPFPDEED